MPLFGQNFGAMMRAPQNEEEMRARLLAAMEAGGEAGQPPRQTPPMPGVQPAAPGGQGPPMPQPQPGGYGTGQVNYSQLVGIPGASPAPGQINHFGLPVPGPGGQIPMAPAAGGAQNPAIATLAPNFQAPQFNRGNMAQLVNMFMPPGMGFQAGQRMNAGGTDVVNDDWNNARLVGASQQTPAFERMAQQLSLFAPQIQAGMQGLVQDPRIQSEMAQQFGIPGVMPGRSGLAMGELGLRSSELFGAGGVPGSMATNAALAADRLATGAHARSPESQTNTIVGQILANMTAQGQTPTQAQVQALRAAVTSGLATPGGGGPGMPGAPSQPGANPVAMQESWNTIINQAGVGAQGRLNPQGADSALTQFFTVNRPTGENINQLRQFLLTSGVTQQQLDHWFTARDWRGSTDPGAAARRGVMDAMNQVQPGFVGGQSVNRNMPMWQRLNPAVSGGFMLRQLFGGPREY